MPVCVPTLKLHRHPFQLLVVCCIWCLTAGHQLNRHLGPLESLGIAYHLKLQGGVTAHENKAFQNYSNGFVKSHTFKKIPKCTCLPLLFHKNETLKRFTACFISISQPLLGQKLDCKNLVYTLFFLSIRKYMHFAPFEKNTIGQPLAPIISLCNKKIALELQWQIFTVDYAPINIMPHYPLPGNSRWGIWFSFDTNICPIGGEFDHLKPRGCACSITTSQIPRSSPILRVGTGWGFDWLWCPTCEIFEICKVLIPTLVPTLPGRGVVGQYFDRCITAQCTFPYKIHWQISLATWVGKPRKNKLLN